MLIDTGDVVLIENSHIHNFWGNKSDGNGENNIGKILVKY
jgi:predicted NAD-dependent protein-ADP-ribosyltransferase YbiA (DUF1768 family)